MSSQQPSRTRATRQRSLPHASRNRYCKAGRLTLHHVFPVLSLHRRSGTEDNEDEEAMASSLSSLRYGDSLLVRGGHLGHDGHALQGHLMASHPPHRQIQLPPRLHRAPAPEARYMTSGGSSSIATA
ncbi:hypothetical protein PR202_ga24695 [Eleusine coracana subsp. coracana]|uniref:Uncharacterized protein n=1 Tax=Eleusine coracana subsp. coracana TaxID=191504 RepID=A0AAV5D9D9_ELECO|nr:hypothetical protein PR202_ga24695 [Eleusine coracana subsp. coracana]